MSDAEKAETKAEVKAATGGGMAQIAVDFGPVAIFMITYNLVHRSQPTEAIFVATGVFMAATALALAFAIFKQKRVPPMLLVTAVIVGVFGGLTIYLKDALFIKLKPTIINLLFASAIFGGLLFKQNVWKMLFRTAFTLPDRVWNIFAIRWGLFFIFLAALNEFIWRNFSEEFWANFKFLGVLPITFLFAMLNAPLMMKHMDKEDGADDTRP
jgi:intracellular septation protein